MDRFFPRTCTLSSWVLLFALAFQFLGHALPAPLFAQPQTTEGPVTGSDRTEPEPAPYVMEPVVVTVTRVPAQVDDTAAAVSVVEEHEIRQGRPAVTLDGGLARVPGLFLQNAFNFAQDQRISIRGFGARSAFGIRGIQILVDGIPHTLPDGQSQIDSIDPGVIERIEVIRGPMSALYGNASGGVINIVTREGPEIPLVEGRAVVGEYGLVKTMLQGGGRSGRTSVFLSGSRLQIDGYREHAQAETWKMNGKVRFEPDLLSDLTLVFDAVSSPELKDPGGLTLEQVRADRKQASPLALQYDIGEEVLSGRLGLVFRRELTPGQSIEAAGFYGRRDLENAVPFRFIELDREVFGGRLQYSLHGQALGFGQHLFAGLDLQRQNDQRLNFDNVGGARGQATILDQDEQVTGVGASLQNETEFTERLSLVIGGRYDLVRFEIDDRLPADGEDSGSLTMDQVTGRAGLTYRVTPWMRAYGTIAQSFETPTSTEVVNRPEGGGGINRDIEPQRAINYEAGVKGTTNRFITYSAAVFFIELEDELIAFRDETDRVFYRNAGESHRKGAELGLKTRVADGLELSLSYTLLQAEFDQYVKGMVDLSGNEIPGLPNHLLFGELLYEHPTGLYAGLDVLVTGGVYVDDENTLKSDGYVLANMRAGYARQIGAWSVEPFLGVQNLLDEEYNGNVRINAAGGRYFEPAPGRNFYGGMGIVYRP
jgi:iron complex outermembrane recepter protein